MRKKIYQTVHVYEGNILSVIYKYFMILVIAVSLIPLTSKETIPLFIITDKICFVIYIIDFLLRMITADYKFNSHHWSAFVKFPFRLISVIDLLSIFALLVPILGWTGLFKAAEALKVFRVVRIFRYSKGMHTIIDILKKSKKPLMAVGSLALGYILVSAIIMFNTEPDSFQTFFDAVYWATVSLTTVGYGDIYPVTVLGRIVAMLSSFFGIAIVALPAGVVTAEYLNTLNKKDNE